MTAFGYVAGTAKIEYSWGPDKEKCKAQRARQRKEARRKHKAKAALRKKLTAAKYAAAMKVLKGDVKGCKGAKKWAAIAAAKLKNAKRKTKHQVKLLKKCQKLKRKAHKNLKKAGKKASWTPREQGQEDYQETG